MATVQLSGPERLATLDLSMVIIEQALRRADAESDTCSAFDPPILEGLLRWARATRFLREALVPAGWSQDNPRNLARTIHPSGEFAVVLATGDEWTGRADYQAGPRHARGYATQQAIYTNGQLAFDFGPLAHLAPPGRLSGLVDLRTWFLLFHAEQNVFQAELSLPEAFDGRRITRWTERVLLPDISRLPPPKDASYSVDARCLTGDTLDGMATVSVRDLRNHGGEVLDRVSRGESVVVTRDGAEVAEIRPLLRRGATAAELIERRRNLPPVDPELFRRDLDSVLDPSL